MGQFFRAGRLVSADTFRQSGTRTLAAATESDLWDGVAATRPWPAAEQLRIVSTSAEDDNVKTQSGTITIAGTMDPIVTQSDSITVAGTMQPALPQIDEITLTGAIEPVLTDEWDCLAAGAIENGDICRLTLDGAHYDTMISPAIANIAALVAAVADAAMLGSFDVWSVLPGGTIDAADEITLTIPGATASPYVYVAQPGDTAALVSSGLKALVDADGGATYTAAVSGSTLLLSKTARGAGAAVTCTWTVDPGLDATATVTHAVTGLAAQAAWTVTDDGINTVNCLRATPGATAGTVASSFVVDGGAASTFVASHTVTGADADIARVTIDGTPFSYTVLAGDALADVATGLAAAIHGQVVGANTFTAVAALAVITLTGTATQAFTTVDATVNNQAVGAALAATPATTQAAATADIARVTLNGTPYSCTIQSGDTTDTVATALAATLHALAAVNASAVGAVITVTAATPGTAGAYTLVDSSVNNQAGGVALTCAVASVAVGANPDILEVTDGTTTYTRTVASAVLADEVAALAALINADAAYIASAIAGVITVSAAVPGVGFTFTDNSTDLQTADLSVVIDNTANMANGGGTGLRTLRIAYLDGTGAEQVETVTMDGLTPVLTTATDVTAIQSVTGITFGSTGAAVGAVSIKDVAAAVIFGTVDATQTQEESATYRIPLRKKGWVVSLDLSAGAVATTVKLKSDCNPATGAVVSGATFIWGSAIVGTDPATVTPAAPWGPFPAAAKVWLTGLSAAGTACSGAINGYLEPAQ